MADYSDLGYEPAAKYADLGYTAADAGGGDVHTEAQGAVSRFLGEVWSQSGGAIGPTIKRASGWDDWMKIRDQMKAGDYSGAGTTLLSMTTDPGHMGGDILASSKDQLVRAGTALKDTKDPLHVQRAVGHLNAAIPLIGTAFAGSMDGLDRMAKGEHAEGAADVVANLGMLALPGAVEEAAGRAAPKVRAHLQRAAPVVKAAVDAGAPDVAMGVLKTGVGMAADAAGIPGHVATIMGAREGVPQIARGVAKGYKAGRQVVRDRATPPALPVEEAPTPGVRQPGVQDPGAVEPRTPIIDTSTELTPEQEAAMAARRAPASPQEAPSPAPAQSTADAAARVQTPAQAPPEGGPASSTVSKYADLGYEPADQVVNPGSAEPAAASQPVETPADAVENGVSDQVVNPGSAPVEPAPVSPVTSTETKSPAEVQPVATVPSPAGGEPVPAPAPDAPVAPDQPRLLDEPAYDRPTEPGHKPDWQAAARTVKARALARFLNNPPEGPAITAEEAGRMTEAQWKIVAREAGVNAPTFKDGKSPSADAAIAHLKELEGKKAQRRLGDDQGTVMYRGAESPDLGKGQFGGTFLAADEKTAGQYGQVHRYQVTAKKLLSIDDPAAAKLSTEFLKDFPDDAPNYDEGIEGVSRHNPGSYKNPASELWLFPTENWIRFLKAKGYEGSSIGQDRFIFDAAHVKPLGPSTEAPGTAPAGAATLPADGQGSDATGRPSEAPDAGTGDQGIPLPAAATPGGGASASATEVEIPGEGRSLPASYGLRELADVQSSHNGLTFQPNPRYGLANERDYTKSANQRKVLEGSGGKFKPAFHITDNPDAVNGPPIVDSSGNAVGGNGRTMQLQRVYAYNPAGAQAYRDLLTKKAAQFGLDPADVAKMKQPILVRQIGDEHLGQASRAIADLNKTGTAALTPAERAIADSRRVSQPTLDHIAATLESAGPEGTLAKILAGDDGPGIVQRLIDDGVLTSQDTAAYLTEDNKLTPAAKTRVSKLMLGRFFRDPDMLDHTPAAIQAKLERMAAPVAKLEGAGPWNLTPRLQEALELLDEARAHGTRNLSEFLKQTGLLGESRYTTDAVLLGKALQRFTGRQIGQAVKDYAAAAKFAAEHADAKAGLFGADVQGEAPTAEQAFEASFRPGKSPSPTATPSTPAPAQPAGTKAKPKTAAEKLADTLKRD